MTLDQLPAGHDPAFRCSPWTSAQGVDPIGSTTPLPALLLVEWPLPWPHDVGDIPALAAAARHGGARVMTVVPREDDSADGLVRVVHHRRLSANRLAGVDHRVPVGDVPALLDVLLADPQHDHLDLTSAVGVAPPEVLVCGHGRRDPCCGRWGTLLHVELAARWTGVRVWRCSHTGGHRFAPTAITLPDGRAWAYVEPALLDGIVHRHGDVGPLTAHDRGTSGLDAWAQVVERALFAEHGWSWLDVDVTARTEVEPGGDRARVTLTWAEGSAVGDVEVVRRVPVLVCGQPPEQATKTSPELRLVNLR
jgi:hypothetical protein